MKIKEAVLLIDDMSGDPEQPSRRVSLEESFTVRDFKELEQIVEEALYMRLRRNYSERRSKYNQSLDLFEIHYHYDKTEESGEYEAYFSCEVVFC